MIAIPPPSLYHRLVGWHAPALRRAILVTSVGMVVASVLLWVARWWLAVVAGWDAAAAAFLAIIWPIILRGDYAHTRKLATREDETRGSATVLLIGASIGSLMGVAFTLGLAGQRTGTPRLLLIGLAVLTVVLSWLVVHTVYILRYAHLYFISPVSPGGIDFGDPARQDRPAYLDFAYFAFTIGMTYQVSDTTVRDPVIRRAVLRHALLSFLFGVVILGGSVNLIAGLVK
jgi:uncharacterized membrane protein